MFFSKLRPALFLAAFGVSSLNIAYAADLEEVKNKVQMMCANCHGYDGVATLIGAANLSGQQESYLKQQLKDYRSGVRKNAMMNVIGQSLSDADINNLSAWYANIKITVEPPAPPQ
jgi:cytochrome c553